RGVERNTSHAAMNVKVELEMAEAGYVIVLDPASQVKLPEAESEDVEYFYLTSNQAGSNESKNSFGFVKHSPPESGNASGNTPFLPVISNITGASIPSSKAQYEGFHIAHYQVERAIGRGEMGDVYLAKDLRLGRPVAIKLLRADYHPTEGRIRRIQDEARAVCALNHPNIVTIYEMGEVDGAPFIVSEFIEGDTLRQILPPTGICPDRALEITIQIASALSAAHQMGIVHRDIKPENVMLRSDGYVKVLDFGLAKLSDAFEDHDLQDSPLYAPPEVVMGTVSYMSPEQGRGQ